MAHRMAKIKARQEFEEMSVHPATPKQKVTKRYNTAQCFRNLTGRYEVWIKYGRKLGAGATPGEAWRDAMIRMRQRDKQKRMPHVL